MILQSIAFFDLTFVIVCCATLVVVGFRVPRRSCAFPIAADRNSFRHTIRLPIVMWHSPHHVVRDIKIATGPGAGRRIYVISRHNLLLSRDGFTWDWLTNGLSGHRLLSLAVPRIFKNYQTLFVASAGGGIFRSRDGGLSWDPSNNGISEDNVRLVSMSPCFENDATAFAVGLHGHLYRTMDGGDKWQRILNQGDVLGCSRRGYDKPSEHCIDTEKDAGTESRVAHKLEGITALSLTKTELLLGTSFGLTLYSKDDGDTFSRLMQAPGRTRITCIETPGNSSLQDGAYIGTDSRGVVAVTEGGPTVSNRQPRRLKHITALSSFHNDAGRLTLLACSWRSALFYSTDDGATWTQCGNGLTKELQADEARYRAPHFNAIAIAQDNKEVSSVYVGGFNGPFRANQIGGSWRHIETLSLGTIAGLDVSSDDGKTSNIAVSTCASGLYLRRKIDSSCLPHTFGSGPCG